MRVMIVTSYPPFTRGESEYASRLIEALANDPGVAAVDVVTLRADSLGPRPEPGARSDKVRVHRVLNPQGPWRELNTLRATVHLLRLHPDVLHVIAPFNPSLYGGAMGEPLLPLLLAAALIRARRVASLHITYSRSDIVERVRARLGNRPFSRLASRSIAYAVRTMLKRFDRVLVVSANDAPKLRSTLASDFGLEPGRIGIEPHPSMFQGLVPRRPPEGDRLDGTPFGLTFGFFREEKGFLVAVSAWRRIADRGRPWKLVVAGPVVDTAAEDYLAKVKLAIADLRLEDRVLVLPRYLDSAELLWLIERARVVIAAYPKTQGPSGSVLAALAAGTPTIVTRTRIGAEQLEATGCIWTGSDPEEVADAVDRVGSTEEQPRKPTPHGTTYLDTAARVLNAYRD